MYKWNIVVIVIYMQFFVKLIIGMQMFLRNIWYCLFQLVRCFVEEGYNQMKKSLFYDGRGIRICRYGLEEVYLVLVQYSNKFFRMAEDDSGMYYGYLYVFFC